MYNREETTQTRCCQQPTQVGKIYHTEVGGYSHVTCRVILLMAPRKGAQFVEAWLDGFAFRDLSQKQEAVTSNREEIDRQRKQLNKRKPGSSSGVQGQGGSGSGGKASRGGKQAAGGSVAGGSGTSEDGFAKPSNLATLTPQEYMERDELLKLRTALLKKVTNTCHTLLYPSLCCQCFD